MRRFELIEGTSAKFWQIEISGNDVTTQWGRIGTAGQGKTKTFASPAAAQAEHDALVREKTGKGYKETGGSAGAAPPVVRAPVAVASVPAPPASASSPAPAEAEVMAWTPEMRRRLHPRRSSGISPVALNAGEAFAVLRAHFRRHAALWTPALSHAEPSLAPRMAAVFARLGGEDAAVPLPVSPAEEGVALAMLGYCANYQIPPVHAEAVQYWAAAAGPAFAVEALVEAAAYVVQGQKTKDLALVPYTIAQYHPGSIVSDLEMGRIKPWWILRRILATAREEEWESARQTAERRRAGASPALRCALAYLFPDVPAWAEDEARQALAVAGSSLPKYASALLATVRDGPLLDRLVTAGGWFPAADGWSSDILGAAVSMVDGAGAAAVPVLAGLLDRAGMTEARRDLAEALGIAPFEEALAVLVARLDSKEVAPVVSRAVAAAPRRALPILAAQAGRGAAGQLAETLLIQIVRSHEEMTSELIPSLPESSRRAIETALQRSAPAAPDAPVESLPPVLARPPWLEKKVRREEGVLSLIPRNEPDAMVWPPGLRESWLAHGIPKYWATAVANDGRQKAALSAAGLPPLPAATQADPVELRRFLESQAYTPGVRAGLALNLAEEPLALALWETVPVSSWWFYQGTLERFVATYGLRLLPGLVRHAAASFGSMAEIVLPFRAGALAPSVADALVRLKTVRPAAQRWLLAHAGTAATALIPGAVGAAGKPRDNAAAALRFLAANGREAEVLAAASLYGEEARDAVRAVLDFDPLALFPARLPKMPSFWQPASFQRPLLRDRSAALPLSAVEALGTMLAFSRLDEPYAGIAVVKETCDSASLARFAWDLFNAWLTAGAPSKEAWAFQALGLLGDDESARRLAPLIRQWPGEAAHARAVTGLDVLRTIGTDVALMHLHGIAQKLKFKGLQEKAREKIAEVAEQRDLTPEELADRLVPDLGLDADGSLTLAFGDIGPRAFRVGFDELLRPFLRDAAGKRLPDLPKPVKSDEEEKAKAAQEIWKALKKDVKTLSSQQVVRLELAMCARRRWTPEVFQSFFVQHPLLQHLVRRLVWGIYDGDEHLTATFRLSEDGTLADSTDDTWELPAAARIGIVHRLDLSDDLAAAWGQVLSDYEILQPFQQLGRDVHTATEAERQALELDRVKGCKTPTGKVLGLDPRGWRRGPAMDAGIVGWMVKPLPGGRREVRLDLDPGIFTGMIAESPEQTLGAVVLAKPVSWSHEGLTPFGTLDAITFSELVRDLEGLR